MMIVSATCTPSDPVISVKRMTVGAAANTPVTMEASVHVSVHVLKYQLDQVYLRVCPYIT